MIRAAGKIVVDIRANAVLSRPFQPKSGAGVQLIEKRTQDSFPAMVRGGQNWLKHESHVQKNIQQLFMIDGYSKVHRICVILRGRL